MRLYKCSSTKGADVSARGIRALGLASREGYDQFVRMLLDKGATDVDGEALWQAVTRGHDDIKFLPLPSFSLPLPSCTSNP